MLSIIIPVFNQYEMTAECLEAVRLHTSDYELIIVDNGSTPPFFKVNGHDSNAIMFAVNAVNYRTIRNDKNLGFPVAVNQGIREAKGDTIVLLNNDVVVTSEWASTLESALEEYAIVGPMTGYAAGLQQTTLPVYNDEVELNKVARDFAAQNHGRTMEVAWIIGFCMAFKKSLWEEIGPFDESLWPCSGEELDFCLSARAKGYKVGIVQDVYVHHHGSVTFKDVGSDREYEFWCNRNDDRITKKFGNEEWKNQVIGRV